MSISQFKIFSSQNSGSPVLNGQTGSFNNILDYVLVSGSGWTKPFSSGSNNDKAVYRIPTGSMFYLNVQDSSPLTVKEARVWGMETTLAQDQSGSLSFPSGSQALGGYVTIRKSVTIDTTPRIWIAFADSMSFYFFSQTGDNSPNYFDFHFGDFYSNGLSGSGGFGLNDPYRCIICGREVENSSGGHGGSDAVENVSALNTIAVGNYIPRKYTGVTGSLNVGKHGDNAKGGNTTALAGTTQYPNMPDNALYMSPIWIHESSTSTIRGQMRGLYQMCHPVTRFSDGEQFTGSNSFVSKSFYIVRDGSAIYCIETSNTLKSN